MDVDVVGEQEAGQLGIISAPPCRARGSSTGVWSAARAGAPDPLGGRISWTWSSGSSGRRGDARPTGQMPTQAGFEPLGDPVVAQGAFVGGVGRWVDEAAAVGAGLHAVAAADAVLVVDQHHAVRVREEAPTGQTWVHGVCCAVVAQLGHEERPFGRATRGDGVEAAWRRRRANRLGLAVDGMPYRSIQVRYMPSGTSFSARQARTQEPQPMHSRCRSDRPSDVWSSRSPARRWRRPSRQDQGDHARGGCEGAPRAASAA